MVTIKEMFFKPSTLITLVIIIVFIILALVASMKPDANNAFFNVSTDAIKILVGALAGAVAGEKYVEKVRENE